MSPFRGSGLRGPLSLIVATVAAGASEVMAVVMAVVMVKVMAAVMTGVARAMEVPLGDALRDSVNAPPTGFVGVVIAMADLMQKGQQQHAAHIGDHPKQPKAAGSRAKTGRSAASPHLVAFYTSSSSHVVRGEYE